MKISYKTEDFTPCGVITEDVIGHILEDVEDFAPRYYLAMRRMDFLRCTLEYADNNLHDSIVEAALGFLGLDELPESLIEDLDEVFG